MLTVPFTGTSLRPSLPAGLTNPLSFSPSPFTSIPQGTLQKFVDDAFQAVLSVNRPVPIAVKYLFDLLDELATRHGVNEPETLHIWKTNRWNGNGVAKAASSRNGQQAVGGWGKWGIVCGQMCNNRLPWVA